LFVLVLLLTIPRPAAAIVERLSLEEMVLRSHLILYGTVSQVKSNPDHEEGIVTFVSIAVAGEIKGRAPGGVITLRLPGGVVGDLGLRVSDVPHFVPGERVIAFLEAGKGGFFGVTGWDQGKFVLERGLAHNEGTGLSLPAVDFVHKILGIMTDHALPTSLPPEWETQLGELASGDPVSGPELDDFVYEGYHWPGPNPMREPYVVNVNTSDPGDMLGAIQAAANTWSSVATADFVFTYGGSTSAADRSLNDANEITWKNEGSNGILATTYWWYEASTRHIFEADMVINDSYKWDTSGQPDGSEFDLQSTVLHELGHFLSLGHDSDPAAVMYGYLNAGQVKRVLHSNDIAGISHIYPVSFTPTPGPSLTPTTTPTRTPRPTETPTRTPTPGLAGSLVGRVILQGRSNYSGATVTTGGGQMMTGADGRFEFALAPGTYTVTVTRSRYLTTQVVGARVYAGQTTTLNDVMLPGGDGDNSGVVDIFDLVLVGVHFGTSPPGDPRADMNGDNTVDIYDLTMVGANYGRTSPVVVSASQMLVHQPGRMTAQ